MQNLVKIMTSSKDKASGAKGSYHYKKLYRTTSKLMAAKMGGFWCVMPQRMWSKHLRIPETTIYHRRRVGWGNQRALNLDA